MGEDLGCVLAIRDRPPECLERTLQTYAFQTVLPADRVLLDYGSVPRHAEAYGVLARRFGWRLVRYDTGAKGWSLSDAYNRAVSALSPAAVVFKGDVDVLLGRDVLETAAVLGRDRLCIFACLGTAERAAYPEAFTSHTDLVRLLRGPVPPAPMPGEGIHAYPRRWFEEVGGYDRAYTGWGFEDSDLRARAQRSIGVVQVSSALLVHQWHPRAAPDNSAARNRAHYDRTKTDGPVVRNGGRLVPEGEAAPPRQPSRIVLASRSMNEELLRLSGEFLAPTRLERHAVTGADSTDYFRALRGLDADWVINVDEDAFLLQPCRLLDLVAHMEAGGYAACGMPDGGVVPIRYHNPVACNAFFNVFDLRRVRPAWEDWQRVLRAGHRPEYERLVPPFATRTAYAFDEFQRYYCVFFALLEAGERILYLDADEWRDGVSTLLKDPAGEPLLLHCWYSRLWPTSRQTRRRYRAAAAYARQSQGSAARPDPPRRAAGDPADRTTREPGLVNANRRDPSTRRDLLPYVPQTARRVLHVGCGAGGLGARLKARQPAAVYGVEPRTRPAQRARRRLDGVTVADAERAEPPAADGPFDCIVCGDQLARMRDPGRWLCRAREWLAPDGRLVAQIPNVRHHQNVALLLDGTWAYLPGGLLRPGHLRLFTRREAEKLFYRAGLVLTALDATPGPGHWEWTRQGRPADVKIGSLTIQGLPAPDAEGFYVAGYVACAARAPVTDYGLTSIVLATFNELEYTRQCVESVRLYTDEPYELVVVDNGSSDGTPEYVRSLSGVTLIANAENRGFPAAVNQGIGAAKGQQILLLNNDCLATTGWLRRLLDAMGRDRRVGLVGPCSNCVSGEQQIRVRYRDDLAGLDGFAWDWGKAHDGVVEDTDRLVGFCLLIRKDVIDQIGLLDERFGVGCFEDDDYTRRARQAGFRAVIARDAFVHHFGGRTFIGSGVDFAALMEKNQRLFQAKWQSEQPPPAAPPAASPPSEPTGRAYGLKVAPGGGLLLVPQTLHLSLCMIVRDNARTIGPALESIRPWVDEMVVVDTGSQDGTPRIADRLGARLFRFPWCDDFSAARNESLRQARGRWVFWMDSDDTIDEANGRVLRELARRPAAPSLLGYVMKVRCPDGGGHGADDYTEVDHLKLFRNLPHLRFEGRIHEQIIPAINRAGGTWEWTDLFVVHSGSDHSPEGQAKKLERDLRILHQELQVAPEHPFVLFNLGMTYRDGRRFAEAERYLRQSLRYAGPQESHLRKAYSLLVDCCRQQGRADDAWEACAEGLRRFPEDAELCYLQAGLLQERGRYAEAVRVYRGLFHPANGRHFSSRNRGITGFLARQNLAVAYTGMGDLGSAEEQWRLVVQEKPRYRAGWRGLADILLAQGKEAEARELAGRLAGDSCLRSVEAELDSRLAMARGDFAAACRLLEDAARACPNDPEPQEALCRLLFEHGQPAEAERALVEKLRRDPEDAAAYHNLGTVRFSQGRPVDAADCYLESLRRRPDHPNTLFQLGQAYQAAGRVAEAAQAWREVLRLVPGDPEATNALARLRL
jgi:GT2 family glycosyltransferase/tetratricopeptide (TPR) repeat protein/SAM-dependent methyltransferase